MKKHRFNIFPEAKPEDFAPLLDDIRANGFDDGQPITLYQGDILDGWNRQRACDECGVTPRYTAFTGTDAEAIAFVMRTNKRRNLNTGQWAVIAGEAEEMVTAIAEQVEKERREKQAASQSRSVGLSDKNLSDSPRPHANDTATRLSEIYPTNRTYINQGRKLRETAPDIAERVKAGHMTFQDAKREAARRPTTDEWLPDERKRQEAVERGETVVANFERDKHLIQWAQQQGKLESINRSTKWGNPFVLDADGNRDEVCDHYADHYLPHKPSLQKSLTTLRGKVLACHCYPQRCHGDALRERLTTD